MEISEGDNAVNVNDDEEKQERVDEGAPVSSNCLHNVIQRTKPRYYIKQHERVEEVLQTEETSHWEDQDYELPNHDLVLQDY